MNHLALLLYFADVCGNIQWEFTFLFGVFCVCTVLWGLAVFPLSENDDDKAWKIWRKIGYWLIPGCLVINLISAVIPSKDTVYAMAAVDVGQDLAAVDVGQDLAKTPTASKAVAALNAWLDKQTKKESN